jgi:hypothetical protein
VKKWHQQGPRWTDLFGRHSEQLQHHSGDSISLELGSDQTHGLIADRSDWD